MEDTIHSPKNALHWLQIYRLYLRAFPSAERKPFSIIVSMYRKGKTDIRCFTRNGEFAGFASTINGENRILLDYLAVTASQRSHGIGTWALQQLQEQYAGKGLFVEIESPYELSSDRSARERRKQFYLRNGFKPLNVMASVFGVNMELLGYQCELSFEEYRAFYRNSYSPFAAEHIEKAVYPDSENPG